jgi:hypothetical protein
VSYEFEIHFVGNALAAASLGAGDLIRITRQTVRPREDGNYDIVLNVRRSDPYEEQAEAAREDWMEAEA